MKKNFIFILVIAVVIIVGKWDQIQSFISPSLADQLEKVAAQVNEDAPKTIEDNIRLDKAAVNNRELRLYYTLTDQPVPGMSGQDVKQIMAKDILYQRCRENRFRRIMSKTGIVISQYADNNGKYLMSVSVNQANCQHENL